MNPDIGSILFFHAVLDDIFSALRYLSGYLTIYQGPVVWMHTIRDHAGDIGNKLRLAGVTQVLQHSIVDKIERKTVFNITAHHTPRQRVV